MSDLWAILTAEGDRIDLESIRYEEVEDREERANTVFFSEGIIIDRWIGSTSMMTIFIHTSLIEKE